MNKPDLAGRSDFGTREIENIVDAIGGAGYLMTSAKTGERVEAAFLALGTAVVRTQLDGHIRSGM